ncbi:MAG: hypothetical protein FWE69_03850 [Clostridiales bacterium]|nr:hypothetical protein [Clostridiales bacterium]
MDKPVFAPICLTLYDENDETVRDLQKSVVCWGMMKQALAVGKIIQQHGEDSPETVDAITAFVCRFYDDKVTIAELDRGAELREVMAVYHAVMRRAGALGN